MPNFRIHQEKGNLVKKNKKRKQSEQTSSQVKKKRKLNIIRKKQSTVILDPKIFKEELENEGDTILIDPATKKQSGKKKRRKKKKMSKGKKKKLESLKRKREEKLLFEKYCKTIQENKVEDDGVFLKTSQVGTLTSRQKVDRMANLFERNLEVPDELQNEVQKTQNRNKDRKFTNEAENEFYYKKKRSEPEIPILTPPPPPPPQHLPSSFTQTIHPPPPPHPNNNSEHVNQLSEETFPHDDSNKIDSIMETVQKELNSSGNTSTEHLQEEEIQQNTTFTLQFDFMNFNPSTEKNEEDENETTIDPKLQEKIQRIGNFKENEDLQKYVLRDIEKQKNSIDPSSRVMEPKKYFKLVERDSDIESHRTSLPIIEKEQEIMELVISNDVVIICGETGSGKTTQVPQFLYEGGFSFFQTGYPGLIGVTQPRRVAALSTSKRVSEEMGEKTIGGLVGVHIRYFKRFNPRKTKILYLTDGILLNEIQSDPLLLRYSVIVLDEAHERNINTDILLGWCSRILPYRNQKAREGLADPNGMKITPLKLIIMSATLKVSDFTENRKLFPSPPPIINVESRQFQVTVHFNRRTKSLGRGKESYVRESAEKVMKIHEHFPKGDVLVFLTGRDEIQMLVNFLKEKDRTMRKRRKKYFQELRKMNSNSNIDGKDEDEDDDETTTTTREESNDDEIGEEVFESLEDEEEWIRTKGEEIVNPKDPMENDEEDEGEGMEDEDEIKSGGNGPETIILFKNNSGVATTTTSSSSSKKKKKKKKKNIRKRPIFMKVLPLHSNLQPKSQLEVFHSVPPNTRKIVIATNVAETSITISGIRYVIDCGKAKYKHHFVNPNHRNNDQQLPSAPIIQYRVQWCSKSSSMQRAGRAGRTCPGHCYRLYSAPIYQQFFPDYEIPELLRAPMDSVLLRMKCLGIDYIQNFPFPSPPKPSLVRLAVRSLIHIKAVRPLTLSERLSIKKKNFGKIDEDEDEEDEEEEEIFEDSDYLTRITSMGRKLNRYPLHPRLSKILLFGLGLSQKMGGASLSQYVVLLVSVLSSTYPLLINTLPSKKVREKWFSGRKSDVIAMFCLAGGCLYYPMGSRDQSMFCEEYGVSLKSVKEISKLRIQLDLVLKKVEGMGKRNGTGPDWDFCPDQLSPPNETTRLFLRQVICCGFADQSAELVENEGEIRRLLGVENYHRLKRKGNIRPIYITHVLGDDVPVYFHPTSFFSEYPPFPRFVCYKELVRTRSGDICMCGVTVVKKEWIRKYGNLDWENQ